MNLITAPAPQPIVAALVSIPSTVKDEWTDTYTEIVQVEVGLTPGDSAALHAEELSYRVYLVNPNAKVLEWHYLTI